MDSEMTYLTFLYHLALHYLFPSVLLLFIASASLTQERDILVFAMAANLAVKVALSVTKRFKSQANLLTASQ